MITTSRVNAIVPVSDLDRAVGFYGDTLGLKLAERHDLEQFSDARFEAGDGSLLVYESGAAGESKATVAGFSVEDIEAAKSTLEDKGITFEEYDLPGLKTDHGVASVGDVRVAWFRDPDGNILGLDESP